MLNVCEKRAPWLKVLELTLTVLKLTLWPIASLLVHTTVLPALTVIVAGENLKFEILTAEACKGCLLLWAARLWARAETCALLG